MKRRLPRTLASYPPLVGRRRARDLAFIEQLMLAQIATVRDGDHEPSLDVTAFIVEVRQAIGARECSVDDVCRAVRAAQPSGSILDEGNALGLPNEPTPAERPRARAVDRLLKRIFGRGENEQ